MKHVKGYDTLRAFAVSFVIISHWGPHQFKSQLLTFFFTKIKPDGAFGVDLFFVLSGYLITKILLNARYEALVSERMQIIKSFYVRRMLRIFPVYFLLIFTVAFVFHDSYVKSNILYYITYTSNFLSFKASAWQGLSHTWSLAVEEQFYLIWPWIIVYSPKKYLFITILVAIGIGLVSSLLLYYMYGNFSNVLLLLCITAFGTGALYAYVQINPNYKKRVTTTFLFLLPVGIILFFIHQFGTQFILIRAINSLIAINLIIYVNKESYNQTTKFIFENKLLVKVGKISYGLYLYHYTLPLYYYQLIDYITHKTKINKNILKILTIPPPAYLIYLCLLFLVSILSYKYIEAVFLKLKRHFTYIPVKDNISILLVNDG